VTEPEAAPFERARRRIRRSREKMSDDGISRGRVTGQLLREHLRQPHGAHRILEQDHPRKTPQTTQQLLHRAEKLGTHIDVGRQVMRRLKGEMAVRRILGMLSLVQKIRRCGCRRRLRRAGSRG
jgi:hypothetical protein